MRRWSDLVLVDGRVLCLGGGAATVVRDMSRLSRDAQTEGARRGRAHERAQRQHRTRSALRWRRCSGEWVSIWRWWWYTRADAPHKHKHKHKQPIWRCGPAQAAQLQPLKMALSEHSQTRMRAHSTRQTAKQRQKLASSRKQWATQASSVRSASKTQLAMRDRLIAKVTRRKRAALIRCPPEAVVAGPTPIVIAALSSS